LSRDQVTSVRVVTGSAPAEAYGSARSWRFRRAVAGHRVLAREVC